MKSHTDLPQSKKLAEFLPIKSADMCFNTHNNMPPLMTPYSRFKEFYDMEPTPAFLIPCWSLAALLELIPNYVINKVDDKIYANLYYGFKSSHDNLVDAAYEMICQLKENGKI